MFKNLLIRCLPHILRAIACLPFSIAQCIGYVVGTIWYCLPVRSRRIAYTNIRYCFPHLTTCAAQYFLLKNLQQTACAAFEWPAFWLWKVECFSGLIKKVHNEALLQSVFAQDKPLILAVPHLGAWEAMQAYFPGRYSGGVLYRPPRLKPLDAFLRQCRERPGAGDLIPATPSGIRELFKRLKKGQPIVILPDQVPGRDGIIAPFFNHSARTMTLLPKLVQKTQASVLFLVIRRLGIGRGFEMYFLPSDTNIYDPDLSVAATALNASIEQCIQLAPEQYQWIYKRFKKI